MAVPCCSCWDDGGPSPEAGWGGGRVLLWNGPCCDGRGSELCSSRFGASARWAGPPGRRLQVGCAIRYRVASTICNKVRPAGATEQLLWFAEPCPVPLLCGAGFPCLGDPLTLYPDLFVLLPCDRSLRQQPAQRRGRTGVPLSLLQPAEPFLQGICSHPLLQLIAGRRQRAASQDVFLPVAKEPAFLASPLLTLNRVV